MATRPTPAAAARAAVARTTTQFPLDKPIEEAPKPDGRRQRWERHKQLRRTELVDGVLNAVRYIGADAGMDDMAAHIGVSKTVLYRYFADKNDLNTAALARFLETTVVPRLNEALAEDVDEYSLTRTTISVYVQTVADEPAIYNFMMSASSTAEALADSERLIAQLLLHEIMSRLVEHGIDISGAEAWSYALVGAVQLSTHWWMAERRIAQSELVDYLTMMVWNAIVGVAAAAGSRSMFNAMEHPFPDPPARNP